MSNVKYQYSSNAAPQVINGVLERVSGDFNNNPIFNFNQKFIDDLNAISPLELGASIPHISLSILDPEGDVLENLNLSFFQKPFDSSQINTDIRYSERPVMSLKDISLKTTLASGYLYFNEVVMNVKVHRAESLGSTFLMALLFPGMPFLLEYGWNSDNELLDEKDVLLFAVRTYTLKLDGTGQIDLTIEGTAFNERFNNLLIGDIGIAPQNNEKITTDELDGLDRYKKKLGQYSSKLKDMSRRSDSTINDYSMIATFAEVYKKNENRARGDISKRFSESLQKLSKLTNKKSFGPSLRNRDVVSFHDLIYTMCNDTFQGLSETVKKIDEFRVIYGTFNSKAGAFADKSIAEFPIDLQNFKNKVKESVENGNYVLTVEALLNDIHYDFFENEEYFKSNLPPNKKNDKTFKAEVFNKPDVVSFFISRSQKDPNNPQNRLVVMELYIIDMNSGLPITTES